MCVAEKLEIKNKKLAEMQKARKFKKPDGSFGYRWDVSGSLSQGALVCPGGVVEGDINGGFIAIHMMNTLSTGGFSIQSENKSNSTFAFEFTAYYSIANQAQVPFEVYVKTGSDEA